MSTTNAMIEAAEACVAEEISTGILRIQAGLAVRPGRLICLCGDDISPARRAACPETDKCINCATFAERTIRRRA